MKTYTPARLRWLSALLLPLLISGCTNESETPAVTDQVQIRPVKLYQLGAPQQQSSRTLAGTIQAVGQADLSFRVSGKVAQVMVEVGAQVEIGDALATLDTTQLQLAVDSANAQRLRAQAVLGDAQNNYNAQKSLVQRGVISRISFENTAANLKSASADADAAQTQLNKARRDLEYAVLKAPFSGRISSRDIDPFTNISAGQSVFQMVKEGQREAIVRVPVSLLRYINQEDNVEVLPLIKDELADTEPSSYQGSIHQVGANSEAGNAVTVKILLADEAQSLRSGLPAEVRFNLSYPDSDHLTVPFAAIVPSDQADSGFLFRYNPESETISKVAIQIVNTRDNGIEIKGSVAKGDLVVAAGSQFLHDGQQVSLFQPIH